MNEKKLITMRVGDIVANNFSTAKVFKNLGIDFCCHGETPLKEACEKVNLSSDEVIEALTHASETSDSNIPFEECSNPIRVMRMEHEAEGNRYMHIRKLTNGFEVPEDGCASYRLMMEELEAFVDALFEHIHIENNILFPSFQKLEAKWVG